MGCSLYTDLSAEKIPNGLTLAFACAGAGLHLSLSGFPQGGMVALSGLGTGLAVFMLPYCLGGTGAGDVKLFGALGTLLGPGAVGWIFLYSALFAGIFSLFRIVGTRAPAGLGRKGPISPTFAYTGPAALGYLFWGAAGGLF